MARIFLSSSFRDLTPERAAVTATLRGSGHAVVAMEDYPLMRARMRRRRTGKEARASLAAFLGATEIVRPGSAK